jgi:hypothetical protein
VSYPGNILVLYVKGEKIRPSSMSFEKKREEEKGKKIQ